MEIFKTFRDIANKVEPYEFSESFYNDFSRYMEESKRQSIINQAKAIESASKIIVI